MDKNDIEYLKTTSDDELREYVYEGLISIDPSDSPKGTKLLMKLITSIDKEIVKQSIDIKLFKEMLEYPD